MAANPPNRLVRDPRRTNDLIPHVLDYLAATDPEGLFAEYPFSPVSFQEGYRKVTYSAFANTVNGLASWLRQTLGPPKREYEVVAYMGPNDLRYPALVLAAIKAGYTVGRHKLTWSHALTAPSFS
jgi:acyl-CoA synthetase (AMP-forming)/AMP-acid ligase II